tara:strand:+ start:1360 stop:2841 length:1482 start_codon:yes stop_codon:yes gene_type:complete
MPFSSLPSPGYTRRRLIAGALGGIGAFSLPHVLQLRAEGASQKTTPRRLIVLWQDGGPSHHETFDPKPDAPAEYRGELSAIPTALPGVRFCEILPQTAALANRFNVIRSVHQPSSGHVVGTHNFITGHFGARIVNGRSEYPDCAALIHRIRSRADEEASPISLGASTDPTLARGMRRTARTSRFINALPGYIALGGQSSIGLHRGGPAYLGPTAGPFQVSGDPSRPRFQIQNLQSGDNSDKLKDRRAILAALDRFVRLGTRRSEIDLRGQIDAADRYTQQAFDMMTGSGRAARAFDLSREDRRTRERYGLETAGQQTLLARRLVESGVDVVAVRFCPDGRGDGDRSGIGWDDHAVHGNIFQVMRRRGGSFDRAVSALIEDLDDRGLSDEVLVLLAGEFGRTPRIYVRKGCPGREHWGPAGNVVLFGGGLSRGQVVGSTNRNGERPATRPVTPKDVLATVYQAMGIDVSRTFTNTGGRPVPVLPEGEVISELLT